MVLLPVVEVLAVSVVVVPDEEPPVPPVVDVPDVSVELELSEVSPPPPSPELTQAAAKPAEASNAKIEIR